MSCSSSTIGRSRRAGRDPMRLPADAALIVIDMQEAIDDPRWGPRNNPGAEANIAALIAAWRAERAAARPCPPRFGRARLTLCAGETGHRFKPCAAPLEGEPVVGKNANSAFVGTGLEGLLDELGATTLVICGVLTPNSVEATARHAGNLGYQVFRRRRRLLGGRQGRSSGQALAGRGCPCAVARASPRRVREGRRPRARRLRAAAAAKARQRLKAERASGGR